MGWAKFDDRFSEHRKTRRLWRTAPAAVGLLTMAITYSAAHETDGVIDRDWFEEHCILAQLDADATIAALVDVGFLEQLDEETLQVHDYLDYQPSREKEQQRRAAEADRKARGRDAQKKGRRGTSPGGHDDPSGGTPAGHDPDRPRTPPDVRPESSGPDPTRPDPSRAATAAASHADAHEAAGDPPPGGGGGDLPVPMAWAPARQALARCWPSDSIEQHRRGICDELRKEGDRDRPPIDWGRLGEQLEQLIADGTCQAITPLEALRFGLGQRRPPFAGDRRRTSRPATTGQPKAVALPAEAAAAAGFWPAILADARARIGDAAWDTWLSVMRPIAVDADVVTVTCPSHAASWIADRLVPTLEAAATRTGYELRFVRPEHVATATAATA
ncbi:Chromosomal replication initiator protein DnaA [Patulibacter medicamentivorans]|uniref:Chromosomal replication initiator protein DnaA n=1 Tax=Patulibacter medicamentivorans TaxID=1097667 RepID=H0EA62_9ACTN|nr:hypothetical protein [Patulibacter medicamentivorans]EHN09402.1 Chromosomal replication initiator protein DnaA [Patulibacter medicamentivorans]